MNHFFDDDCLFIISIIYIKQKEKLIMSVEIHRYKIKLFFCVNERKGALSLRLLKHEFGLVPHNS